MVLTPAQEGNEAIAAIMSMMADALEDAAPVMARRNELFSVTQDNLKAALQRVFTAVQLVVIGDDLSAITDRAIVANNAIQNLLMVIAKAKIELSLI